MIFESIYFDPRNVAKSATCHATSDKKTLLKNGNEEPEAYQMENGYLVANAIVTGQRQSETSKQIASITDEQGYLIISKTDSLHPKPVPQVPPKPKMKGAQRFSDKNVSSQHEKNLDGSNYAGLTSRYYRFPASVSKPSPPFSPPHRNFPPPPPRIRFPKVSANEKTIKPPPKNRTIKSETAEMSKIEKIRKSVFIIEWRCPHCSFVNVSDYIICRKCLQDVPEEKKKYIFYSDSGPVEQDPPEEKHHVASSMDNLSIQINFPREFSRKPRLVLINLRDADKEVP